MAETITDVLTPLDVEIEFRIPRASQKKGRARGSFAPFFRVGRRVYYRRSALLAWITDQEREATDTTLFTARLERPESMIAGAGDRE